MTDHVAVLPHPDDEGRPPLVLSRAAPRAIEWTAEAIADGRLVAIPTDTVYGLAASLSRPAALRRLYEAKGRPLDKPIPILASSVAALSHIVPEIDPRVLVLVDEFWPGPLTVVMPARAGMPRETLAADGTVGVRVPRHPLALEVIEKAGGAVACTSANESGAEPARTAAAVVEALGKRVDLVLDGGIAPGGVPSTVVAPRGDDLIVLRAGAIDEEALQDAWCLACAR